jgi:hypothetical protein
MIDTPIHPDFDTSVLLPPDLHRAFLDRRDGVCLHCGFYQAYARFSDDQLRAINALGKDISTREPAFHVYPAPAGFVEKHTRDYFGRRLERWAAYLDGRDFRPGNSLFLRPFFGAAPRFIKERYGGEVGGVDMSQTCLRTTLETVPGFKAYGGIINGMLEGEFLSRGPFDAVFVFHTLIHATDIHRMVGQLRALVRPGGLALFSHEVVRKPNNPFHMAHLSEPQLVSLLSRYFGRIDRLDACDDDPPECITKYSAKGDSPDFAAWAV